MDPKDVFKQLKATDLGTFGQLFNQAVSSAFRLEMLDFYTIPGEIEEFRQYKSGQIKPPPGSNQKWLDLVAAAVARGVDFNRVRLVREPIHEYLKFEIAWGYRINVSAGEKVSCITYASEPIFKTEVPILKDFWMFDEARCYLMEYDLLGRFLGVNEVPGAFTQSYRELKLELLRRAVDIRSTSLWEFAS